MSEPVPGRAGGSAATTSPESLAREGYARHGGELFGYALTRLRDRGAAEDAVQETILRAWRAGHRFDPTRSSLRTWLFAIARNVVLDQHHHRARHPDPIGLHEDDTIGGVTQDHAGGVASADLVARALELISHDHRTAIVETYLKDRPYAEVAAELDVEVSTLRSRVFHGLRQLRTIVETLTPEGEPHA